MESIYLAAIIALIAGVALLSIAILAIIKQKRKDIEEKEEIIERLKQELNATNIKYIQAEERFLAQKNILEQERKKQCADDRGDKIAEQPRAREYKKPADTDKRKESEAAKRGAEVVEYRAAFTHSQPHAGADEKDGRERQKREQQFGRTQGLDRKDHRGTRAADYQGG